MFEFLTDICSFVSLLRIQIKILAEDRETAKYARTQLPTITPAPVGYLQIFCVLRNYVGPLDLNHCVYSG